ncbi:hypothetical protein K461DRAFT_167082 [Myriangium duriaei CBS 260.36]|uniref:Uncharacterized protein n=1 Tax=Myriangium duriaei CBS 260.36 TaxID=1168546 RepID=A0A9P4IWA8_9PEZI|nr:hypothetical protein K461DRAFT_167082 [Myriangium duriaei CBS 260.36]
MPALSYQYQYQCVHEHPLTVRRYKTSLDHSADSQMQYINCGQLRAEESPAGVRVQRESWGRNLRYNNPVQLHTATLRSTPTHICLLACFARHLRDRGDWGTAHLNPRLCCKRPPHSGICASVAADRHHAVATPLTGDRPSHAMLYSLPKADCRQL